MAAERLDPTSTPDLVGPLLHVIPLLSLPNTLLLELLCIGNKKVYQWP